MDPNLIGLDPELSGAQSGDTVPVTATAPAVPPVAPPADAPPTPPAVPPVAPPAPAPVVPPQAQTHAVPASLSMSERDAAVQAAVDATKAHGVKLQQKSLAEALVARARAARLGVLAVKAELLVIGSTSAELRAEVLDLAAHVKDLVEAVVEG